MSYARPGDAGGSDVYVIATTSGLVCYGGSGRADDTFRTTDPAALLAHLDEHEQAGDLIPSRTRPEIEQDWADGEFADWDSSEAEARPEQRSGPRCTHCHQPAADHHAFGKCPIEVDGWRHTFTEEGS